MSNDTRADKTSYEAADVIMIEFLLYSFYSAGYWTSNEQNTTLLIKSLEMMRGH